MTKSSPRSSPLKRPSSKMNVTTICLLSFCYIIVINLKALNGSLLASEKPTSPVTSRASSSSSSNPTAIYDQQLEYNNTLKMRRQHQQYQSQDQQQSFFMSSPANYYYTRTRKHPNHLRISEELKNQYVDDVPFESKVNGTKYEYYKSSQTMSYDELVFEIIDKIFRHRLSPFYIHHYDNDEDKRRSSNPAKVSTESCARDLLYLVEKLPKRSVYGENSDLGGELNYGRDERMTPELTAFFDSYARQEAGLLMGNTFWVGAYDQCVNRHIFEVVDDYFGSNSRRSGDGYEQQVVSFKGQYCVSSLKAPVWDQLIENKKRTAKNYFKSERQIREYSKLFRLQVGICLPDSCDSTAFERHKDEIKLLTKSMLEPRYADYELIDLYCLPDESSPLRKLSGSAIGFVIFMALWLGAVLLATLAESLEIFELNPSTNPKKRLSGFSQFVCWFSLQSNYRKLMHVSIGSGDSEKKSDVKSANQEEEEEDDKSTTTRCAKNDVEPTSKVESKVQGEDNKQKNELPIDLRFLNAFKAIIMFWIINGHIMLLMIQTAKNILDSDALLNGLMHFLIGATFGVDLFFTMTGFLTAYLLFNSGHAYKMKPATWIYLSFHRYWRLAPMYLLAFWFSRSVMQSLGAGPLWDYGTSSITFRGLCNNESWWYPLTLTSNLHGLFEECMITSWYISCDMQFWLVSPIFVYLLAKSPLQGWTVTIMTILASSKLRYDAILSDKSARYDELVQPRADIFMRVSHDLPALYTHPHYRISAYLVGLLAGHYVYMLKSRKWTSILTFDLAQTHAASQNVGDDSDKYIITSKSLEKLEEEDKDKKGKEDKQDKQEGKQRIVVPAATTKSCDADKDDEKTNTNSCKNKKKNVDKETEEEMKMKKNDEQRRRKQDNVRMTRAQRSRRLRNLLAITGLIMFLIMAFVSYLLANHFPTQYLKYSKPLAGICYSVDHLAMSVGASLVIVTLCLGQWKRLVNFLSHPNWTRLSKINYALLLLQCEAIYYQIFRYDQVPMAGTKELTNILFNLLVTLYPLAFLVTLVFEFPLANIEKLLLGQKSRK